MAGVVVFDLADQGSVDSAPSEHLASARTAADRTLAALRGLLRSSHLIRNSMVSGQAKLPA
jgi:hypothetical protein